MFEIKSKDKNTKARTGILKTRHGKVNTPFFMPVVTKGAPKFLTFDNLNDMKINCFISNAYLLYLKPGLELLKKTKGLHNFIGWQNSIFTDSGGFQLLDPAFLIKINDDGVKFRSPYNGDKHFVSPEFLMEIQNKVGSDVAMLLDHVLSPNNNKKKFMEANERTIAWAKRCEKSHSNKNQEIMGIVQGGTYKDLRKKCAVAINNLNLPSVAIGGLAIGETKERMYKAIDYSLEFLDKQKMKYLMGVGSPQDIVISIGKGVDCFDSVYPTKMARHGVVFTKKGNIRITKDIYKNDFSALDKNCSCPTCKRHTRAYLHHLFRLGEPNAKILLSIHNIHFVSALINECAKNIENNTYASFSKQFLKNYKL